MVDNYENDMTFKPSPGEAARKRKANRSVTSEELAKYKKDAGL